LKQNNALLHFSDTVGAALRDGDTLVAVIGGTPTAPSLESRSVNASNNFTSVPLGQTAAPRTSALNDFSGLSSFSASQSTQTASSSVSTPSENWWGAPNDEKRQIWTKELRHNGLLFPPAYEPHGIPMKYDGQVVPLPAEAEEMASCFARYLETDHVKKPVFCRNFFRDFTLCLKKLKFSQLQIEKFELCDFSDIANHLAQKLEQKRNRTQQERESDKHLQQEKKEKYGFVMLDGKKEPLGNYMVEPPGLFLGRGEHPKAGCWKRRITPEDITLNLDESSPIPESPVPGHSWGSVVHQREVSWIAFWTDDLTSTKKYALFSASSSVYARSNRDSFEKARQLKRLIGHIRTTIELDLSSPTLKIKQRATAFWFIDRLALRVGSEKDDDNAADTVGCCSLRVKHIKFPERNRVELDYVGADSMLYINTVTVPDQIFNNLQTFVAGKAPLEPLFELITVRHICLFTFARFS
jgi:DNA topoisomerase I